MTATPLPSTHAREVDAMQPDEAELQELVSFLTSHFGEDFVALALFGSQARGTATEDSDVDLLLIASNLEPRPWTRSREIGGIAYSVGPPHKSILARTPDEFLSGFPSYYLDLGLDAVVLYDTDGFLTNALARIREIIEEAGLERRWIDDGHHDYVWEWTKRQPVRGKWSVTWEGYDDGRGGRSAPPDDRARLP